MINFVTEEVNLEQLLDEEEDVVEDTDDDDVDGPGDGAFGGGVAGFGGSLFLWMIGKGKFMFCLIHFFQRCHQLIPKFWSIVT